MTARSAVLTPAGLVPVSLRPRLRWSGAGVVASLGVHGGLLGALVWATLQAPPPPTLPSEQPLEMVFVAPPPPPAPPVQPVAEPPPEPVPVQPPPPAPPEPPVIEPPPPVLTSTAAVATPVIRPPEKKKTPPKKKDPPPVQAPPAPVPVVAQDPPPVVAPPQPAPPQVRGPVAPTPDYLGLASAHLQKFREYPRSAQRRGIQGRGSVLILLGRDGQVRSVTIRQSTGSDLLDEAMLKTVQRANPLPPNPQATGPDLELLLPFDYGLR